MTWSRDSLNVLPRLGWAQDATPITELPELSTELGLDWVGVKRDDLTEGLNGSTKTRKLDFLLASDRLAQAGRWASMGAIGSGHLASLTLAAKRLDRHVDANCFWEPPSLDVTDNLACIASGPSTITYVRGRVGLALRRPRLVLGGVSRGAPVILPGGSSAEGVVGCVRAGLELAEQIEAGVLPRPDRIYLPWGTGGTSVGIGLGLAIAGCPIPISAIATVERPFATRFQLRALFRTTAALLDGAGVGLPPGLDGPGVEVIHGHVGKAYGHATARSLAACERLESHGVRLEPIYGGKAFGALLDHVAQGTGPKRVLYWLTSHRGGMPSTPDWKDRLPKRLTRDLERAAGGRGLSRRRVLVGGLGAAGVVGLLRTRGYGDRIPHWEGSVLSRWEAEVVAAAAEAVIPDVPGPLPADGPDATGVAANVDRYLRGMSKRMVTEIHGMMILLEQGTGFDLRIRRLTQLAPSRRTEFLVQLGDIGGLLAQAARGIRDLCLLGWYQDPRTWKALGYGGPLVAEGSADSRRNPRYDALIAPAGALPTGATS